MYYTTHIQETHTHIIYIYIYILLCHIIYIMNIIYNINISVIIINMLCILMYVIIRIFSDFFRCFIMNISNNPARCPSARTPFGLQGSRRQSFSPFAAAWPSARDAPNAAVARRGSSSRGSAPQTSRYTKETPGSNQTSSKSHGKNLGKSQEFVNNSWHGGLKTTIPIGSMVLLYMVTWIPSIYPQC